MDPIERRVGRLTVEEEEHRGDNMALYNRVIGRVTEDEEEDTRPRLLSSEFDTISEGISNAWNALPEPVREGATNTANFIRNVFIDDPGSKWNQALLKKALINVEGEEVGLQKFNALNEGIRRGDHDPIGQVFGAAIEGVSQVPTAVGLPPLDTRATRTGLALYTLGKTPLIPRKSNLYGYGQRFRNVPPSKRIINVNAEAIDSVFKMPPAEFQAIIRLAKDSGINSLDLARRFNEQQGILKTYLQSKGRYGPLEGTRDLKGMATAGGNQPVPDWIYSTKGANFDRQRSDRLGLDKPPGMTPQQERTWFAKVTYPRVKDEVLAQGGTEAQAKSIYADHRKNFLPYAKGGSGMVATISELNRMAEQYAPGIQLRTETYTKDGEEYYRWQFKDKDGKHTRWDLKRVDVDGIVKEYSKTQWAKDHIIPVMDKKRIGGGYIGADNEFNLEPLLHFLNIQKSNTTQLYPGLLKESGVPETFSEYINMKLYPQNYEGMFIPQRFKENFQKIVMAEYNEKSRGVQSGRQRAQIMDRIISTHAKRFKDPVIIKGLKMLEEALGQQIAKNMEEGVAAGNEVPAWLGLFKKPPGGWNSKDPWWTSLPENAKTRYRYVYEYEQRTIRGIDSNPNESKLKDILRDIIDLRKDKFWPDQ